MPMQYRGLAHHLASVAIYLSCAAPLVANAELSLGGYLRAGLGATGNHDGRACYALEGTALKYRLGNECDIYGELQVTRTSDVGGIRLQQAVMFSDYQGDCMSPHR